MGGRAWVRAIGAGLVSGCLVVLILSSLGVFAHLAPSGPPPAHARPGRHVPLSGTLPRALAHAQRVRREDGTRPLQLTVSLRIQHPTDLQALIASQQDPKSAKYHKHLSPQAFADQFGPAPETVAAVRKFLEDAGLRVTSVSANRLLINASGTAAQAEKAFDITISQYQLDQRTVFAPDQEPTIPDTLAPGVQGIVGLDNVGVVHPLRGQAALQPARPSAGPGGGFTPTDLRNAYDVTPLISAGGDGTSQRIAVFELAPYIPGDLAKFRSNYGLPSATVNNHSVDGATVTCATAGTACDVPGVGEGDLDVEIVSGLAPYATQDVYTGPQDLNTALGSTFQGALDTYLAIVTDNVDKVVTTSWGLCEPAAPNSFLTAEDNIFVQAAAQGQTIFAASGDAGSADCVRSDGTTGLAVDSPASDPYVVGVGGTTLSLSGSGSWGSEITWNDVPQHIQLGSGGGNSSYFSRPAWQFGQGLPDNTLRLVPDVAANAEPFTPGYSVYCTSTQDCGGNGWMHTGGTSASAPLWAGILADVNRYLIANGVSATGWLNLTLYQLLGNSQMNAPFHDVTSGTNDGPCYDEVTGAGTPDAWNIARDIQGGVHTAGGGPCPAPPNTSMELVQDGGFETIPGPWQQFSALDYPVMGAFNAHTGSNVFFPCLSPACDDRVWQSLQVPSTVNTARLTFWLDAYTSVPGGLACLDHFYVTLATLDGTVFDSVMASCASNTNGYTLQLFNMTAALQAHVNQHVLLMLRGTTANEAGSFYAGRNHEFFSGWSVDDVSLTVS